MSRVTCHAPAFTLIELLVVIAIMGVLAGMLLAVVGGVKKRQYIWNSQAELAQIATAIERYKAAYGFYPPSTSKPPATGDPLSMVNQLYFELEGTTYDPAKDTYTTLDGSCTIAAANVNNVFPGVGGFMNCTKGAGEDASKARNFLPDLRPRQVLVYTNINTGQDKPIRLLLCSVGGPDADYPPLGQDLPGLNPWRYNSATPTNNPGSYDLWVQLKFGGKTNLICNWSKQVQISNPLP